MAEASLDRIEAAVADAERGTSCEIVVVLAPASDRYEGRVLRFGAAVAVLAFLAIYAINAWRSEFGLDALLLLLEAAVAGGLAALLFARVDALRRMVVPRWRRHAAVEDAAAATFTQDNIGLTRERNGVLIYVSVFEGEAKLMPDIGLQQKLHDAALGEVQAMLTNTQTGDPVALICTAVELLGKGCRECFPRGEDTENELPDRPRIRSV